jgi:DNA-binding response OmpR family regulator
MPIDHQPRGSGDAFVKTILVVEDDADIGSFIVQAIHQETSHNVLLVTDGFQALKTIHNLKTDLFIIDYQLPYMNGIELYDRLIDIENQKTRPTIMISARLPAQEILKRNIVGMKKPFELQDLLNTIERLLALQCE